MRFKRIICGILAALMMFGVVSVSAFAEEAAATGETAVGEETKRFPGEVYEELPDYIKLSFKTVEEKLGTMNRMIWNDRYELYVEPWTGEVYCYDVLTGQVLSTNPYDATSTGTTDDIKRQLLSQIIIKFSDLTGTTKTYNSYANSAELSQINVKNIKGGVRVEYTIGRSESSYLVPRMISAERFDSMIAVNLPGGEEWVASGTVGKRTDSLLSFKAGKVVYKYVLYNPLDPDNPERVLMDMYTRYPVTKKKNMAVYVLTSDIKPRELNEVESYIKEFCPEYTYEELEKDHQETEYSGTSVEPALFKLSLEYKLTDTGMTVSLPANGIRFDETNYTLEELQVLPYLGAGSNEYKGYNFIPDGSGAITRFEDYVGKSVNLSGTLYGSDYAYLALEAKYSEVMRLPVFGIVEDTIVSERVEHRDIVEETDADGNVTTKEVVSYETQKKTVSKGFLAVIEEGEALTTIMSTSGATTHKFYSIITKFEPRPKDQYSLAATISVGSSSMITVVSERKYVGKLTFNLIMLNDADLCKEKGVEKYYDATWVGMASAYRDYLEQKGILKRLTAEETGSSIPLYIETFGVVKTKKKVLSIPVDVDVALTSFEDVETMYDDLASQGITNINFKLTGYCNGMLYHATIPNKVKWEKAAGGESGFKDLVAASKEKGFGIYPDFNFTSVQKIKLSDGFKLKKHASKTINDQYVYKVLFNKANVGQSWTDGILVSPSVYAYFFEKFEPNYSKYGLDSIALSSIGTDLNSDFDTDEPYNREDTKELVKQFLDKVEEKYSSILTDSGNAYALKYFDHILNVSLDSSRYSLTSNSVPFVGFVLHGFVNFAGTPLNMEGDINYSVLKAIESGSSIYFVLSYDNTELLKENAYYARYYAVRYDITREEVIRQYNKLNTALGSLQTTLITGHEFLRGERIPDEDEVEADLAAAEASADEIYEKQLKQAYKAAVADYRNKYLNGEIPAGLKVEYEIPDKPTVAVVVGGVQKDADGNVIVNAKTGELSYTTTKYTSDDGSIVKVTYGETTSFIINYNNFKVKIWDENGNETILEPYSYITAD